MSFFTSSWKVNGFNKRNFEGCQTIQIVLLSLQMYFALILAFDGGAPQMLQNIFLLIICAGVYSFFSPKHLIAVNALQSNGAQATALGLGLTSLASFSPSVPFYCLFGLIALDLMLSSTIFMNQQRLAILH